MKSLFSLSLFSLLLLSPLQAQKSPTKAKKLKPYQVELSNLTEEDKKQYITHLLRAQELFGQKRIFECLESLSKASSIFSEDPAIYNLKGACYVEFRDFQEALKSFQAAKKLDPENFNVDFNIAEIFFVTEKWKESFDLLDKIRTLHSDKYSKQMTQLIDFKAFLCQLKLGQVKEARELIGALSYRDDTPLYYYGNAALAYHGDEPEEAEQWLARGRRVFRDQGTVAPWQDTLIEFGYIKSFYGGDLEVSD